MPQNEYLDFEIEIGPGLGREYPLAVIRSPGGEARGEFRFPFDELALKNRLLVLENALLRSGGVRRLVPTKEDKEVQEFGQSLFDALMTGEIRSRYDVSQREANRQGKGLRLKLRIQPPELASLPWEFMYDTRAAEYVCLSTQTPLVRFIELPQVIQPLTVTPPLRILGLLAAQIVFVISVRWAPKAVLWIRQLGGKLNNSCDRDGPYWLLQGLAAVIITCMSLSFVFLHPFPFREFTCG